MAEKQWTSQQKAAIELRGENLLVAAGAGSGKTAVLVERIIQRVLDEKDPVDINRLLVVTFTNAAAAEMRQRIGSALFQKLKEVKEPSLAQYLQKQLSLLNIASITTLHSFCLDLLRENYLLLNLNAKFSIANEMEKALLIDEVLDSLLEEEYQKGEKTFLALIDSYGGREDELARKIILELYQFSLSQPNPITWLESLAGQYALKTERDLTSSSWYKFLAKQCLRELQEGISFLDRATQIALLPEGPQSYYEQLQAEKEQLGEVFLQISQSSANAYQAFSGVTFATLRSKGKCNEALKEKAKNYRDKAKAIVQHWKNDIFVLTGEENLHQIQDLYAVVQEFIRLAKAFYEKLQKQKAKKSLVDFSDLEHFALQLLEDRENGIAVSLQNKFVEVLVDEYQDINHAQEAILQLVSRGDNRFFVGDVKQSIYRFRLAEPGLFLQKYFAYSRHDNGVKIDLAANFRSQAEILNGVNFVFAQLMDSGVTEIDYDEDAYLRPRRTDGAKHPIEFSIIDMKRAKEEEAEDASMAQREARFIGKRILQLIEEGYQYRDMVILLRSTKNWAGIFQEEFQLLGIPCYAEVNSGYFEAPEIALICSILQVIDNPYQDIPLAAALLSIFGGFTPDELGEIRMGETGTLYDGLQAALAKEISVVLRNKITGFLTKLEELRYLAMQKPVGDLINKIYGDYHLFAWVGLLPGGTQRQANLNSFYQRAKEYDNQSYRGLYRFIHLIERMQRSGNDLSLARSLSEQESVVRIMSIHHSKGLEFPIVFVAGLGRKFNMTDAIGDVLLHRELGMGIVAMDGKNHVKYQTLPKIAIMQKVKQETLGEELRILYVALTRARDRLFLVGSCANFTKSVRDWAEGADAPGFTLGFDQIRNAKSPLDWLARAVIRHQDGAILLTEAGAFPQDIPEEVYNHESLWQVQILHSPGEAAVTEQENTIFLDCLQKEIPMKAEAIAQEEKIKEILAWQYPWDMLWGKQDKLSVTELQEKLREKQQTVAGIEPIAENDMEEKDSLTLGGGTKEKIDWQYRGTMHHFIFEHLQLSPNLTATDIESQIKTMLEQGVLPLGLAEQIDYAGVQKFFANEIGRQVLQAETVYRELSFLCQIPAGMVYDAMPEQETIVLQGTIDLVFSMPNGWVIVDYKSGAGDYGASVRSIQEKYGRQVQQYAAAFEKITHEQVSKKYIYLLRQGKFIEIK